MVAKLRLKVKTAALMALFHKSSPHRNMPFLFLSRKGKPKFLGSGGSMVAKLRLKVKTAALIALFHKSSFHRNMPFLFLSRKGKPKFLGSGGSMVAKLRLKVKNAPLITSRFDLFQNASGQPFTSSAFSRHMQGLLRRLTGREVSINGLRSSFVTWAYNQRWVLPNVIFSLICSLMYLFHCCVCVCVCVCACESLYIISLAGPPTITLLTAGESQYCCVVVIKRMMRLLHYLLNFHWCFCDLTETW